MRGDHCNPEWADPPPEPVSVHRRVDDRHCRCGWDGDFVTHIKEWIREQDRIRETEESRRTR